MIGENNSFLVKSLKRMIMAGAVQSRITDITHYQELTTLGDQ